MKIKVGGVYKDGAGCTVEINSHSATRNHKPYLGIVTWPSGHKNEDYYNEDGAFHSSNQPSQWDLIDDNLTVDQATLPVEGEKLVSTPTSDKPSRTIELLLDAVGAYNRGHEEGRLSAISALRQRYGDALGQVLENVIRGVE